MSREAAYIGVKTMAPMIAGLVPFGLVAGTAASDAGLTVTESLIASALVFAGAAQIAAAKLHESGATALVTIGTALIINLRFLMYSASFAPHLSGASLPAKAAASYLLTDQAYAVSMIAFEGQYRHWSLRQRLAFYFPGALLMWVVWQLCVAAGTVAGTGLDGIPHAADILKLAFPLCFLAMLVPVLRSQPSLVAAVAGAGGALAFNGLPHNAGLICGALLGVTAGVAVKRRKQRVMT